jgi:hypothetical protein
VRRGRPPQDTQLTHYLLFCFLPSLSWDLVFLARLAYAAGDRRYQGRPLDQIELDWAKGRQIQVLRLLRDTFPTTKIIVQTPHLGTKSPEHVFSPVRKLQQVRFVFPLSFRKSLGLSDFVCIFYSPSSSDPSLSTPGSSSLTGDESSVR